MQIEGGCYCREVRYRADGEALMRAQCHCRECQYIAGGSPAVLLGMPDAGFELTQGQTKAYQREDLENAVSREFCPNCGTHLLSRIPNMPIVLLKVGSLDDPKVFGGPETVFYTCDKQAYHQLPPGVPSFDKLPTG